MAEVKTTRRLAAVLHADAAGYSRLMQDDEHATLRALTAHRALFATRAPAHGGRVVNCSGDSILVEFRSAVDAVKCAVEIQEAIAKSNAALPAERRMQFRIGIDLGDVLVDDAGIYGDGVNLAARLEAMAEPGGICVSRAVRDQAHGELQAALVDMGEHAVKNISTPVHVHRWLPAAPQQAHFAAPMPPDRQPLSIVVLPFANLGGDPEQDYLADGITDELTTELSRILGSFVISRNSAFTYKGRPVDVKQVGRELGVAYALEGSVHRAGERLRVVAQLCDTQSGAHVWGDRFDREMSDLLTIQEDVTGSIARVLRYELIEAASRRSEHERRRNPRAIDYALRAQAIALRVPMPVRENFNAARALYEEALRIDPSLPLACVGLSSILLHEIVNAWSEDEASALTRAEALLAVAERYVPDDARVLSNRGVLLVVQRKPELALPLLEAAHARDPNATLLLGNLGWCRLLLGDAQSAIIHVERALRLDPRGFSRANLHGIVGTAYVYLARYDEAIHYLRLICNRSVGLAFPRFMLAAACALSGHMEEARTALAEFRSLRPGVGISRIRAEALSQNPRYLALRERVYEGLRLAGLED